MVLTPLRAYFETLLANTYLFGPRPAIKIKTSEESNDSSFASPRLPWTLAGPQWNNFSVLMQLHEGKPRLWCSGEGAPSYSIGVEYNFRALPSDCKLREQPRGEAAAAPGALHHAARLLPRHQVLVQGRRGRQEGRI